MALAFAVVMAGTTLPTPLYGLYRRDIGFSEFVVTVVFAVYACGVIAALLIAGSFSDVLGRRPVLMAGIGLSVISAVCFLTARGLTLLFVGRVFSGFSAGLFSGAATAAVMELATAGQRRRAALAATAANMGGLGCGPVLAGLLGQYAPHPLRLAFVVDLALLALSCALVLAAPETVPRQDPRPPLRAQGMVVPAPARAVFTPAAVAVFAGFCVFGLFTAVAPAFLATYLGVRNIAASGAVVTSAFLASLVGQFLTERLGAARSLSLGCLVMVAGLLLIGASLLAGVLALLVGGAVVSGLGQGLSFSSSVRAVSRVAPAEQRGATLSALFVAGYVGLSIPVVGIGAVTLGPGLRGAGIAFVAALTTVAAAVAVYLLRRPLPVP
ncbi:MFS transporter [Streptomyces sp. HPF1205]|uniref:MFS transporter n=1 Tax=Streptomyces sp. HPF1205 TaxID=2873262 RepID=UPI001CED5774|nr:MFS transporter [Streptomyces sp. HPF1205]